MNVALAYAHLCTDDLMAALAGGTLTVYSVARPVSADLPVERSGVLATFTFSSPAFGTAMSDLQTPQFTQDIVPASGVGTPGFARACMADGTIIADFSAGPGNREIKFNEVSFSNNVPVSITEFRFMAENAWPERRDYYDTKPRSGYPLHQSP
ncbi:MAG: hypothetical protein PHT60_05110 [Acidiphilium sp.]|nr:hypothetical protein [Acidiphilium sp.]MDD4935142.1 hypothetical protein [Acidiphilium sp.]